MRVISGKAKGRKLKQVPGDKTRPISDRVKENLFNILGDWVVDTRWLDLFAGTGQVGIEALSRGATTVIFIDLAREAIRIIRENLEHTGLMNAGVQILHRDAFAYLQGKIERLFDVVYVAPPQYKGLWKDVLLTLDLKPEKYITEEGMVIVQIDPKEFEELALKRLILFDQRKYGRTMLCFYEIDGSIVS